MTRNMGMLDRALRFFVVLPAAVVFALIVGPRTVGGLVLFAVAGPRSLNARS